MLVTHDGIAKITDFGLVRSLEFTDVPLPESDTEPSSSSHSRRSQPLTRFGAVVGTAPYMSPEQCEAKSVDVRSDIYALGATIYHLLTGQAPVDAKQRFLKPGSLVPMRTLNSSVSPRVERAIAQGGIRLGVLDNTKSNADHLLRMIIDSVKAQMPVASVVAVRKENASTPAAKELIDKLEKEADFVISGMGD